MQTITEETFRKVAQLAHLGSTAERIAKRTGLSKHTVEDFIEGRTRNPVGMAVFEETTRPPGITKDEHEAWLASNGYRGFAEAAQERGRRAASHSQPQG